MQRKIPFMIWWAILVHFVWGFALIVDPSISPLVILVGLHWIIALGTAPVIVGGVLIAAALFAMISLIFEDRIPKQVGLLMLMPQYAILIAAFVSDSQSIITGKVDAREIDQLLLFTALAPIMIAAVLHSMSIIERYLWIQRK